MDTINTPFRMSPLYGISQLKASRDITTSSSSGMRHFHLIKQWSFLMMTLRGWRRRERTTRKALALSHGEITRLLPWWWLLTIFDRAFMSSYISCKGSGALSIQGRLGARIILHCCGAIRMRSWSKCWNDTCFDMCSSYSIVERRLDDEVEFLVVSTGMSPTISATVSAASDMLKIFLISAFRRNLVLW